MTISEKKMQIVIDNYFKSECDVNTSIRQAFEKGFRIGIKKVPSAQQENTCENTCEIARTSNDCISRQKAIDLVKDVCDAILSGCNSHYDSEVGDEVYDDILEVDAILTCNKEIRKALKGMQPAQPEQKLGKWVDDGDPLSWVCSECGYRVARYNNTPHCPNCGSYNKEGRE